MEKTAPPHHHDPYTSARLRTSLLCGGLLLTALPVVSQAAFTTNIKSDGTLPTPTSVSQAANVYNINGGTIRGSNLFHSFQFFSVGTGDIASFNGPGGIANILSRVTGGQQSMIDGQLRSTIAGANLYLLNPAGVLFGPNASLNVSGSFHVTTADYLRLTDNVRFNAVPNVANDALLTTAPVAAFGFLGSSPASVSIQGSFLQVPVGKTLSVIGGDINITSGTFGAFLGAGHGQINIASVASSGEVIPNQPGFPPALDVSSFATLGTITESNFSNISVSNALGNGTVVVRGGRLMVTNNAQINANNTGNFNGAPIGMDIQLTDDLVVSNNAALQAFSTGAGQGGNIQIAAGSAVTNMGSVQLMNGGNILSATLGTSKGPDILINTGTFEAKDGGYIYSTTRVSSGRGGTIDVTAGSVLLANSSNPSLFTGIDADVSCNGANCNGTGQGGNLNLTANSLQILNGAFLSTPTWIRGPGGNLTVNAGDIFIKGSSNPNIFTGIFANVFGTGKGGNLSITSQSMELTHRATIGASSIGPGDAGNTTITTGSLDISDISAIQTSAYFGSGNGGNLNINANSIVITGTNSVTSFTTDFTGIFSGTGPSGKKGGDIHIAAGTLEVTDKGSIDSGSKGNGNAGNITLDITGALMVENGGTIHTSATGSGHGGDITISAGSVTVSGVGQFGGLSDVGASSIVSQSTGSGDAGNVSIAAGSLNLLDGGGIATDSFGAGKGGNISLSANKILISGLNLGFEQNLLNAGVPPQDANLLARAGLRTNSSGTGNAGNISITAADQFVMRDGAVTTQATLADGGNIDIQAGNLLQLVNSIISTSVGTGFGNGGNITIDPILFAMQNSQILANAFGGNGGNIHITADLFFIDGASLIDASSSLGISGTVTLSSPTSNLSGSLVPLQEEFLHAGALLQSRCAVRIASGSTSSFVVAGRDGVPAEPGGLLPSPLYTVGETIAAEPGVKDGMIALNLAAETLDGGCTQ